ncbi:MAG: ACP S-malonyltransferase [Verrucomicrobiae bacterium]|nr:ACP S-malonyltransferase [Verrucomicrobiae bacterium]
MVETQPDLMRLPWVFLGKPLHRDYIPDSMEKTALLFAGQGAQFVGMGKELYDQSPAARALFNEADQALGVKLTDVCFTGPADKLTDTSWCQPAIFTHSLAALAAIREKMPDFQFQAAAGLSLGEWSALTAAGWIKFSDAVKTVRLRGQLMQEACLQTKGGMASVMGMDAGKLKTVCDEAGIDMANLNCPGQIVVSGTKEGIDKAMALAKERGAKRAIPLAVAGAYHSRLMQSAAEKLRPEIAGLAIQPSNIAVISNVTAAPHEAGALKEQLVRQITSSVRWEDSMRALLAQGFRSFIELGPGEVLAGLLKRIDREARVISAGKPADLAKLAIN